MRDCWHHITRHADENPLAPVMIVTFAGGIVWSVGYMLYQVAMLVWEIVTAAA